MFPLLNNEYTYTSITNDQNLLSRKVNKLPITSIDLCYIFTKKTASIKNP